jgi:type I restriction enzyme M protein
MITPENFRDVLILLGFKKIGNVFEKDFPDVDAYLRVDFDNEELKYPEDKELKINERQICTGQVAIFVGFSSAAQSGSMSR